MYYVYMLANKNNRVLYTGVTNNLLRRLYEHKNSVSPGFTQKYRVNKLVWFEETDDISAAIGEEKRIKGWKRYRKNELIDSQNPKWEDLSEGWF